MGRRDELLWIRPLLGLEPLAEVVGNARQNRALRRDGTLTILQPTLPHSTRASLHTLSLSEVRLKPDTTTSPAEAGHYN